MFEAITRVSRAYKRLFLDGDGRVAADAAVVLADLRRFCHVDRSTLKISPVTRTTDIHATMQAEGRREVYVWLTSRLHLDEFSLPREEMNDRSDTAF